MKQSGIYKLQFPSGHYYIGSSQDYVTRCRQHQNSMKYGKHDSPRVQNVFNKYKQLPIFGLLIECMKSNLQIEEQKFLDINVGINMCLNISKCAEAAARGIKGRKCSEEHKEHLRKIMKDRFFSDEHRKRISDAKKGIYNLGAHTPEANAKRSASLKGKIHTQKAKELISKKLMGHKPAFSKSVILLNTGEIFDSAMLAERITKAQGIGRACRKGYTAGKMLTGEPMKWAFHNMSPGCP